MSTTCAKRRRVMIAARDMGDSRDVEGNLERKEMIDAAIFRRVCCEL